MVAGLTWLAWENWGKSQLIHWMRQPFRWREERWVLCSEQFTRRRPLAPLMPPLPPDFSPVNGRRRWTGPRMGGAWDLSPTTRHHHRAARWIDQSFWKSRGALKQVAIVLQSFRNFFAIILVAWSLFMSKIRCKIFTKVKHANCFSNFEWQLRIMLKKICTIFNCFYSTSRIGLWKSLAIYLLKDKTKYPKCERSRYVKMQATSLAVQQQFGTWSYKTGEKNV